MTTFGLIGARAHRRPADSGQVTAEYAVGTLGAVSIAAVLIGPGAPVPRFLWSFWTTMIERSLTLTLPDLFRWPW